MMPLKVFSYALSWAYPRFVPVEPGGRIVSESMSIPSAKHTSFFSLECSGELERLLGGEKWGYVNAWARMAGQEELDLRLSRVTSNLSGACQLHEVLTALGQLREGYQVTRFQVYEGAHRGRRAVSFQAFDTGIKKAEIIMYKIPRTTILGSPALG